LIDDPAAGGEVATAQLSSQSLGSETNTNLLPHTTDVGAGRGTGPTTVLPNEPLAPQTAALQNRTHRAIWIALIAIIVVAISVAAYFLISKRKMEIDSVAVLPFENKSGNADSEYLSDGLTESLIYRLSQLPNLKVSPTGAVLRYKGATADAIKAGTELGVSAVMSGRMVQRGDSLTLSVELVDVRSNKLLWGEQYQRKMSELLATQREIAAEIANKLQLKLNGDETKGLTKHYTNSNEAYQLYLKGRYYWNKRDEENLKKAIEQFKGAADSDPNFALAFSGLADCYNVLPFYTNGSSTSVIQQAKAYAQRALEIDDSLAEAHTSLAYANYLSWNWPEAERGFKKAIELNPNYASAHKWYANYLSALFRSDEALAEYKKAQQLEPLSLIIGANLAEAYLGRNDAAAAEAQCHRTIEMDPNWFYIRELLSLAYLKQGRKDLALAEAQKAVELAKRGSYALGALGYIDSQVGKRDEALALANELKERYAKQQASGQDIARIYLGLGDKDQTFEWLEKDFQSHSSTLSSWLNFAPFDSLVDEPRYRDLLKRMGIPK